MARCNIVGKMFYISAQYKKLLWIVNFFYSVILCKVNCTFRQIIVDIQFVCFFLSNINEKMWIKVPNELFFKHHFSGVICFYYWDYLTNIWHQNWWSNDQDESSIDKTTHRRYILQLHESPLSLHQIHHK